MSTQSEFTDWLHQHAQTLMKAARAIAWHEVNADDIFQEAMADVYSKWEKLKAHPNLVAYAISAMRNKHIDMRRKWERKRDEQETELHSMTNLLLQTIDESDAIAERLLVQAALASLTPSQRIVLFMHEVEGFTIREITQALDLPQGTVASHLNRGKIAIGSYLKHSDELTTTKRKSIGAQNTKSDEIVDAEVIEE